VMRHTDHIPRQMGRAKYIKYTVRIAQEYCLHCFDWIEKS
jgi:hypothetical protein